MVGSPVPEAEPHLLVAASSRDLKRRLGPMAWAVLEDVALDAAADEAGRLVATTSSRAVAENLGLTPGTAARALGRLRSLGLVSFTRHAGPAGRFGLAAYVIGPLPGIEVRTRPDDGSGGTRVVRPRAVSPRSASPRVGDAPTALSPAVSRRRQAATAGPTGTGQLDLLGDRMTVTAGRPLPDPTLDRPR